MRRTIEYLRRFALLYSTFFLVMGHRPAYAGSIPRKDDAHKEGAMEQGQAESTIGSATMLSDGTIVLDLRARREGMIGDARLYYPPTHPEYKRILNHLGGLNVGETKLVRPFQ